ncbi:MAG: DUF2971 domain-containing protein [Clostridia bacterium]|nr:DUF2971 domain-containing protein [Clostridia bacterium]
MNNKDRYSFLESYIQDNDKACIELLKKHLASKKNNYFIKFINGSYDNKNSSENIYLKTLKSDCLWFSKSSTFNDPFDCLLNVDIHDLAFNEALAKSKGTEIAPQTPSKTEQIKRKLRKKSDQIFNNHLTNNPNIYPRDLICCLSEISNLKSLRMWGHYANAHSGFCLCYDIKDLGNLSDGLFFPVVYGRQNKLTLDNNTKNAAIRMLVKAAEWSYEKEWRIIKENPNNVKGLAFDNIKPKAVYIGCKASAALKTDLTIICKEKKIDLYQMNIKPGTFSLYPTPIDLKEIYQ